MKKWYKIVGYVILVISGISWTLILVVPWLGFSKREVAGLMTALIITGEITFYLSIAFLGKSIMVKIKKTLMFWKKKKEEGSRKTEVEENNDEPTEGSSPKANPASAGTEDGSKKKFRI